MKANFNGEFKELTPNKIIKKDGNNKVDNFFLVLGLVYNDFKSINLYLMLLEDYFSEEKLDEASCNTGEYHGMRNHLSRLLLSTIYEFFKFLENNEEVLQQGEFIVLQQKMSSTDKKIWNEIIDIACNKNLTEEGSKFKGVLRDLRNKGSYHYDGISKKMRRGYLDHFFNNQVKTDFNSKAYYSKGSTMEDTRYFYCDAAIQTFHAKHISDRIDMEGYNRSLVEIIKKMNFTISRLLKAYLANRR